LRVERVALVDACLNLSWGHGIGVVCRPGVKKLSVVKEKAVSRNISRFFCLSSLNIGRLVRGCKEIGFIDYIGITSLLQHCVITGIYASYNSNYPHAIPPKGTRKFSPSRNRDSNRSSQFKRQRGVYAYAPEIMSTMSLPVTQRGPVRTVQVYEAPTQ
jgi:hypothetical protein